MKAAKLTAYTLTLITLTLSVTSCKMITDAVTHATPKKEVVLPAPSNTYTVHGEKPGIQNYVVQYDADMYRGGEPLSEKGMKSIKAMGIKTIISVTPTKFERKYAKKYGISLVELPFEKKDGLTEADLKKYIAVFGSPENTPVYVHCRSGMHRGGTLGVAYRLHRNGWTWKDALIEFDSLGGSTTVDKIMLESTRVIQKQN